MKQVSVKLRRSLVKKVRHPSTSYRQRNYSLQGERELAQLLAMGAIFQARHVRTGMKAAVLVPIAHILLKIPLKELLNGLCLSRGDVQRKIHIGARLSVSESARVVRALMVFEQAADVFDNNGFVATWFLRTNVELGGTRPLDILHTRLGFERVCDLLSRLEFGITV